MLRPSVYHHLGAAAHSEAEAQEEEPFDVVDVAAALGGRGSKKPHRRVYLYLNTFALSDINTVSQTFGCHFYVRATWSEPKASVAAHEAGETSSSEWRPDLVFMNATEPVEVSSEELRVCKWRRGRHAGEQVMEWRADCRGKFREAFELDHFPFDAQALSIIVSCKHSRNEVTLHEDRYNGVKSVLRDQFTIRTEFDMHGPFMQEQVDRDLGKFSFLYVYFVAERRYAYYVWNIALPICLLTALTITAFGIEADNLSDRLGITLTLVLTSVAFKFKVAQDLPRINYLTLCDVYVLVSFIFLSTVAMQNLAAAQLAEKYPDFDRISRDVLCCTFLGYHAVVVVVSVVYRRAEMRKTAELCSGILRT